VLAKINGLFGDHQVNVEGQLLGTRGDIGYVITDIGGGASDEVLASLGHMPETIRLRFLA
jgi:D-3-phosphoglycerate dehydrogenase / 2-oxoglutarate reductase